MTTTDHHQQCVLHSVDRRVPCRKYKHILKTKLMREKKSTLLNSVTQTCGISELRISQRSLGIFPNQNLENTSQNKTSIMSVTWLWHLTLHTFFIQLLLEVASNQSSDGKLGQVQTRPNKTRPEEPIHPSSSTECSTGLLVERELTPGDSAEKGVHPGETYGGKQPFRPTFTPMDHKKTPKGTGWYHRWPHGTQ